MIETEELPDTTEPAQTNAAYPGREIPEWMKGEVAEYDLELNPPPKTILDIGANVGAFTLRCHHRWPGVKIIAYEPVKSNAEAWRSNCAQVPNASLEQCAVRRFNGQDLILMAGNPANCGFYDIGRQKERGPYVDCLSASKLPPADLVKIDTEGCEVEILEKLNLSETKAVVCEWHRTEDRKGITDLCVGQGFKLHSEKVVSESGDNGILKFVREGVLKPKAVKLFIGLPIYSQAMTQFMQCMFALQAQKPFDLEVQMCQGDGIARSRNQLTAEFLKTDCTHLLFIDCDLIFSADHVKRIASHDVDVVGGFYAKKQQGKLEWVINTFNEPTVPRDDYLQKVAYAGTGFLCIRRNVFEKMRDATPWLGFGADYGARDVQHEFWPMAVYCYKCRMPAGPGCNHSPKERRYLSEDWFFCQKWMDLGGEIFMDTKIVLKHIGPCVFPLDTQMDEIMHPKVDVPIQETDLTNERV